ncbi:ATP-binding protein [Oceanimonas baumannii]|uniref:ATP-binding protein n=1 Tax=Oceanimonas baumannii TaxID=129578 RepID=UPI001D17E419|nr:ATP-binding protein [Oceanimonas baumannii]MCC4264126.1 ATP-binding protein [Oceanimonas baumannii]
MKKEDIKTLQHELDLYEAKKPRYKLDDGITLSSSTMQMFDEAIGAMKFHKTIYSDWGFGDVDPMGRNMVINLYGPPGTGKTMAAESLAGTLDLNFIHISISEIESKFVGETAKNISKAFKKASEESALIFFDEADTLLGKRLSSVTQGIDNEINAMRSTLLIELERFDGIVVFATNFVKNYDSAFISRIRYHIEFTLPDFNDRKKIFDNFLVPGIPLDESKSDIIERCAESSQGLSGREIRTVLRLSFPKALMESKSDPIVKWTHIEESISKIKNTKYKVEGKSEFASDYSSTETHPARKLLGTL